MLMMVLQFSSTCVCWVMKLWKTIWIGKLWLTRTGPCLTHTLSQHGAPSLDMEATSWVKDSSLNDCSILYYNQQCTRYYFGSSPQLSFVRPGRLVVFQACRIFLRSLVCCCENDEKICWFALFQFWVGESERRYKFHHVWVKSAKASLGKVSKKPFFWDFVPNYGQVGVQSPKLFSENNHSVKTRFFRTLS